MKQHLKQLLNTLFPVWSLTFQSIRSRRLIEHQCRLLGLTRTAEELAESFDNKIVNGIFTGMMLSPDLFPQHLAPKYLGTYEDELNFFLHWCIKQAPDAVVNVGRAEGRLSSLAACKRLKKRLYWRAPMPRNCPVLSPIHA